jgi:Na+/phosphate symporter
MNKIVRLALLLQVCLLETFSLMAFQSQAQPQVEACKDQETVVATVKQDILDTVSTVKKESLDDFERQFHQQASMSKLSICLETINDLLSCLDKASHDPQTPKDQLDSIKSKQAAYQKLKTLVQHDIDSLKAAKDSKTAKAEIEKYDFAH